MAQVLGLFEKEVGESSFELGIARGAHEMPPSIGWRYGMNAVKVAYQIGRDDGQPATTTAMGSGVLTGPLPECSLIPEREAAREM